MGRVRTGFGGRFALSVAALAVMLVVTVMGISALRSAGADSQGDGLANREAMPVAVLSADYEPRTLIAAPYPALIQARRESTLGFPAAGQIAEIGVDVGDRVEVGQVLAALDVRALEAQRAAARADIRSAQAQARLAQVTLERQRQLVQQGHVSPQALDEAQANADAAAARIGAAQATADALSVQIDLSRLQAPFDGVITQRAFDEGASVGPGVAVLTVVEGMALEVRAGLPLDDAARLDVGDTYTVALPNGRTVEARLRAITDVIDPRQRTVSAVFDVPQSAPVSSGEVGRLMLEHPLEERGFWASVSALSEGRRGLWVVYVLTPSSDAFVLEPRPVEILHTEQDRVYLRGAVQDGDQVLAGGVHRVAPGQYVRPVTGG